MHSYLARFQGRWVSVTLATGLCLHGIIQELTGDLLILKSYSGTETAILAIPLSTIMLCSTSCHNLTVSSLEAAYDNDSATSHV